MFDASKNKYLDFDWSSLLGSGEGEGMQLLNNPHGVAPLPADAAAPAAAGRKGGVPSDMQTMMDYYSRIGQLDPEKQKAVRARTLSKELREGSKLGDMRQAGRLVVARSPLEGLSSVVHSGLGAWKGAEANELEDAYGEKRRGVLADWVGKQGFGGG